MSIYSFYLCIYSQISFEGLFASIKNWKENKKTFFQRHTEGQQALEKMFNITNCQKNANQKHSEISPHTYYNGYHKQELK